MPHFLINKEEIKQDFIELLSDNENFFHIVKVLRAKVGEKIKFIDEFKVLYNCKIVQITKKNLKAQILTREKSTRFLKTNICLIQSILANDAQNLAIANAVQSGVREIYPVVSDNISSKKEALGAKVEKWQKIALENFKQCERADLTKVHQISFLKETLEKLENEVNRENIIIFAEKYANKKLDVALAEVKDVNKIILVVGCEGGFSEEEFEYFKKRQYNLVSLGKMIYKAPNAIIAGVSNVVSRIESDI